MIQSTLHVAVIMDGNGRWAAARGLPRTRGHEAGAAAVRRVVEAAPRLGVATLTLYAFSADNWRRPAPEVASILELLRLYLRRETRRMIENEVRCSFIGRRDRLPAALLAAMDAAEAATRNGTRMWLRLAIDYSSRQEITAAIAKAAWRRDDTARRPTEACLDNMIGGNAGSVDLLIRTGGERRLSDFLLWESAYAELVFTKAPWPQFGSAGLRRALAEYGRRERRFGGIEDATTAAGVGVR